MKLSDYRKDYYEFSGKASEVARQLAFAGIAIVWVFTGTEKGLGPRPDTHLVLALALFALALGFDLLHYISATVIWGSFQWREDRKLKNPQEDPHLAAPAYYNYPQLAFFVLKLTTVTVAYVVLIVFLWLK